MMQHRHHRHPHRHSGSHPSKPCLRDQRQSILSCFVSVFPQKQTKGPKPSEMTTSLVSNPRYIQAIRYIMLAPALVPSIKVKPQLWGLSSALAWKLPKCPDLTSIYYNYGCENADQTVQAARMPLRHMIWCLDKSNALTISLKKILDRYKTVAQLT